MTIAVYRREYSPHTHRTGHRTATHEKGRKNLKSKKIEGNSFLGFEIIEF